MQSGHIPNSFNIPYTDVINNGFLKSKNELENLFREFINKKRIVFTCGSGITASILAFAAFTIDIKNFSVYDGSWTEWASSNNLPINKI